KPLRELSRLCLGTSSQSNSIVITADVIRNEPPSGLPLLQVWPSDSPRGDVDGEAFIFPDSQHLDSVNDSGIESIQ
ncbi:hypothetical protein PV327_011621, partial [Microctonus hyperodae]